MDKVEFIAKIRHICWCCYQMGAGQEFNEDINEDQLASLIKGVQAQFDNPNMTPEESHNNWMKMKASQGWVYGPIKDFLMKTHPDMVPYNELPEVERAKDDMSIMAHKVAVELFDSLKGTQRQ